MKNTGRLAPWLKRPIGSGTQYQQTTAALQNLEIQTICTNANCPNQGQCWSRGTATVLILGSICTRNCKFCSVAHGKPLPPDTEEPRRVADLCEKLGIRYLVITSVDRDDLPDGGASHFRDVITTCRGRIDNIEFEILTPDFRDCPEKAIDILHQAAPFVFGHNVETVPELYPVARPGGDYLRSLGLLKRVKEKYPDTPTKSSIMLGLGETTEQVDRVLQDLRDAKVERLAIGQYLRPSKQSLEVVEFIEPEIFDQWKQRAKDLGFTWVMSSPFTRSSYHAEEKETF